MPPMEAGAQAPMPPPSMMGLFGLISGLAKQERMTPMDKMAKVVSLLEEIRELDPEKTGINVSIALSVLKNGPDGLQNRQGAE